MEFIVQPDRIFMQDESDKLIAEVTFPGYDNVVTINHTFVDESLRGQGIAEKLMEAVAQKLRHEHKKAILTCSYAIKWFETHAEYADILK
ncbi:GNAT family N-acetyltransferase [Oscillospiraceae bacterium PP1C4]